MTWYGTAGYILLMVGLAMVGTVPLAELLAQAMHLPIYWLYAPIAIGIVPSPEVILRWLLQRFDFAEKETPK